MSDGGGLFTLLRDGLASGTPATDAAVLLVAFAIAWLTATAATPRLIEAAKRFGIVDRPDGALKTHAAPVPYLGGLAVALGVLVALGLTYRFEHSLLAVLLSASIVLVIGLLDDLGSMTPWRKLAGQVLAVFVLVKAGVTIQLVFLPPIVAMLLSAIWLLAAINAFNLIDIMDGLSSGVGAIAAAFFAGIALFSGLSDTAYLGAALAGALLGFRRFNVAPARIYLGDTGSMFVGLLLGALAMVNDYTDVHRMGMVTPLLILAVPLFDMLFVMYVRFRRGMPVMLGSPDHVALRLRRWRLGTRGTVRVNMAASALLGAAGVAVMLLPLASASAVLAGAGVLLLVLAVWLRSIDMGL